MLDSTTTTSPLWRPWSSATQAADPLQIVEGRGTRVRDGEGNWYLDGISGVLNTSCGHAHPRLVEAATRQLSQLSHYDLMVASHPPAETLAARLAALLPGELNEMVLLNSGSEAIEAALRIALTYWRNIGENRDRVITFANGYHGSTSLAQQLSGLPFMVSDWETPFPIEPIPFPVPPGELRTPEACDALVARFAEALDNGTPAAAVLVEPLLSVAGMIVLPTGFLSRLRELCDRHGTLLVVDEVFCGFGRTGRMFGFEHEQVVPDIVTMSKALSGGCVPMAVTAATSTLRESFKHEPVTQGFRYGHTTGGHAVASAVANAVLDVITDEDLVANAATQGAALLEGLSRFRTHPGVVDVRGLGLATAIETDALETSGAIVRAARRHGLMIKQQRDIVLVVPPLTITSDETAELVKMIDAAFDDVAQAAVR